MLPLKTNRPPLFLRAACSALVLLGSCHSAWSQTSPKPTATTEKTQPTISSQADLDQVVAQLEQPATRLIALSNLVRFAHLKLYQVGSVFFLDRDAKINALQNQAVEAIKRHADLETVSQALESPDRTLQFWGVWFWRKGAFFARDTSPNVWLPLLPKIEKLAAKGDSGVRLSAVEGLERYSTENTFLKGRLEAETSPTVLLRLMYLDQGNGSALDDKFNLRLLRLLNHPDPDVRQDALLFIGFNPNAAPVWQIKFSTSVEEKVRTMTASRIEAEKKAAIYALDGLHKKP